VLKHYDKRLEEQVNEVILSSLLTTRLTGEENCSGILVWQLNDIWPGTSWALVDVDLHRKPSFYITQRALAPVVVGMERVETSPPPYITMGYRAQKAALDVWAVNGSTTALDATLELTAWDIESGAQVPLPADEARRSVRLKPNQSNELTRLAIPQHATTVVAAALVDGEGRKLARWVSWPEPLKFVRFKEKLEVRATVERNGAGKDEVVLTADAPAKGVVVSVPIEEGEDAVFADNFVDLVPGEEMRIGVEGLAGRRVQARWLCDWEVEGFQL
jgi:beta-mannosidase